MFWKSKAIREIEEISAELKAATAWGAMAEERGDDEQLAEVMQEREALRRRLAARYPKYSIKG